MKKMKLGWLVGAVGMLGCSTGCSTALPTVFVKPVPDEDWQYHLSSEPGARPSLVREAFEAKAREICAAAKPSRIFRFIELRADPRASDPDSVKDRGIDGVIECVEP